MVLVFVGNFGHKKWVVWDSENLPIFSSSLLHFQLHSARAQPWEEKTPILKRRARPPETPPPRILQNLWGSPSAFCGTLCIVESLLKNPPTESQRFCRTLAAKPSCSDPANSSPKPPQNKPSGCHNATFTSSAKRTSASETLDDFFLRFGTSNALHACQLRICLVC